MTIRKFYGCAEENNDDVVAQQHFKKNSGGKIEDPRENIGGPLIKRSALGLIAIYNILPENCKKAKEVKERGGWEGVEGADHGCKRRNSSPFCLKVDRAYLYR